ncbi:hypothetical protein HDU76_010946 [Blyttiomyces sp. JEL0837]|nr:hypothetical protein HDU76_010946 [Blyttiomyces sp. JEL0837]
MPEVLFTTEVMDNAAASGNLRLVKYLYYKRSMGCTKQAVGKALDAREGARFEIVRFLVEVYPVR